MRRGSKSKTKKSDTNGGIEDDVNNSVKSDKEETGSINEVESSESAGRKRNSRSRAKTNEGDEEVDNDEIEENGKSPNKKKKTENDASENGDDESNEELKLNKSAAKKNGKSNKGKKKDKPVPEEDDEDGEEEYEVEKIVDQRTIKGRRQFLVRWKGYSEEHDTWEQEKELNCDRLIEEFLAEQEENAEISEEEKASKAEKKVKTKKQDKNSNKQKKTRKSEKKAESKDSKAEDGESEADESKEYEVEKIIEVHFRKDKKREFLIRWKGFSSHEDTWEPEENLNCTELIERFMEKLEKIRNTESRELRANPSHTKRYTLTMHGDKRQSRRNAVKQRVTYYECDV